MRQLVAKPKTAWTGALIIASLLLFCLTAFTQTPEAQAAVTLAQFRLDMNDSNDGVIITWVTGTEESSAGFFLKRATSQDGFTDVPGESELDDTIIFNILEPANQAGLDTDLVEAVGSTVDGGTYRVVDMDVTIGETYYYMLVEMEESGTLNTYGDEGLARITVEENSGGGGVGLGGNDPTPTPVPPTATPTPLPTATSASSSEDPEPTSTPIPTNTPEPTATAVPEDDAPEATATPLPEPTATETVAEPTAEPTAVPTESADDTDTSDDSNADTNSADDNGTTDTASSDAATTSDTSSNDAGNDAGTSTDSGTDTNTAATTSENTTTDTADSSANTNDAGSAETTNDTTDTNNVVESTDAGNDNAAEVVASTDTTVGEVPAANAQETDDAYPVDNGAAVEDDTAGANEAYVEPELRESDATESGGAATIGGDNGASTNNAVIGSGDGDNTGELPLPTNAPEEQSGINPLLWLVFAAGLLIFGAGVVGSILIFSRRRKG